ncbi:hypothetical protein JST97_38405 [bacterium]|nr:hypothetical protein [bacterium]
MSGFRAKRLALTLAEILLATALIALAALALVGVQLQGMRLSRQSRQHWAANQLLRDEMARIQDMAPDFYPTGTVTFSGRQGDARTPSGFPPLPYPGGQRDGVDFTLTVTHQPSGPEGHLFTVKAEWGVGSTQLTTLVGP